MSVEAYDVAGGFSIVGKLRGTAKKGKFPN